ncbi:DUF4271 domain-containing protein [Carboxylicivirga taeanensis]|uniref:DUF4271 domain-containing protein n=1 Tax=Carboxylicivirga taeanensis TaxID=1416875 RepID=UPI003F6E2E15
MTEIQQQIQGSENQQLERVDSLATSKNLRTPIQQAVTKEPKYLQVQRAVTPKKVKYKTWSAEDSVYFNLIASEDASMLYTGSVSATEGPISDEVDKEKTELADTVVNAPVSLIDSLKTIATPPVIQRKSTPFEDSKDWLAGFILLALVVAGFIKLSAGRYLNDLFSSIRYQQSATKLFSSRNLQNQKPSWALTGLFFLSTSMLVFEFTHIGGKTPERLSPFSFFVLVNAGVIGYFFIKNLLYRFVAAVFDAQQSTREYLFNANMLSKVFGIACLPIVCVVPFVDITTATLLLKAGLGLFIIMYIIQLLRGAKIILRSPLSIFYMFLYFCALEILPLSVLIKVMIY